ncbi:MAG: CHRD domain-containing protein [Rudaea sp.]
MFKQRTIALSLFLGLAVLVLAVSIALATGTKETTIMTGAAERPGPGDPDGSGVALIELNQGQGEVCFTLQVQNITLPATGAHIHHADASSPGPVVIPLTPPDASGISSGCVPAARDLIKDIRKNPAEYYVNVHNVDYPAGAIRGQLGQ